MTGLGGLLLYLSEEPEIMGAGRGPFASKVLQEQLALFPSSVGKRGVGTEGAGGKSVLPAQFVNLQLLQQ